MAEKIESKKVYALTRQVPRGRVTTYGALAEAIGRPRAARAIGGILRANREPIVTPCHRVVRSDGTLGGYGGKDVKGEKERLLSLEGVSISEGRVTPLLQFLFTDFKGDER